MTGKAISSAQLCKQHCCTAQHNMAWQLLFPLLIPRSPSVWMYPSNYTQASTGTEHPNPPCRILAQDSSQALKSPCLLTPSLARSRKLQQDDGANSKRLSSENQLLESALSLHKSNTQMKMGNPCSLCIIIRIVVEGEANDMKVKI